jgi:hypothetical protein
MAMLRSCSGKATASSTQESQLCHCQALDPNPHARTQDDLKPIAPQVCWPGYHCMAAAKR